jgi:hypothetical protein
MSEDLPVYRAPLQDELLSLTAWLLEYPRAWPDDKMRLHEMLDHFEGRWEPATFRESTPQVRVMRRGDSRKIQQRMGLPSQLERSRESLWTRRRTQSFGRRKPSSAQLVSYGRRVVLMLQGLDDEGELPAELRERTEAFSAELDAAATVLALGGQVA